MNKNQKIITVVACMVMILAVITAPKVRYIRASKIQMKDGSGTADPVALAQRGVCVLGGWGALFILAGMRKKKE